MATEVYLRKDIKNVIRSAEAASGMYDYLQEHSAEDYLKSYAEGYRDGFRRALVSVGLAFGIEVQDRRRLMDGRGPSTHKG